VILGGKMIFVGEWGIIVGEWDCLECAALFQIPAKRLSKIFVVHAICTYLVSLQPVTHCFVIYSPNQILLITI
jgi:hypothetical protein